MSKDVLDAIHSQKKREFFSTNAPITAIILIYESQTPKEEEEEEMTEKT